jgi:transcriptional regulator of arginine metabolism
MNSKQARQRKILDLISSRPVGTQEDLAEQLRLAGIETAQSTLSKDLRELAVVKVPSNEGGARYVQSVTTRPDDGPRQLLTRVLTDFVVGWDGAENTFVVKTVTGHAQGVCEAIDQEAWPEVVGTIAGENTIFVLCRSRRDVQRLGERIAAISGGV